MKGFKMQVTGIKLKSILSGIGFYLFAFVTSCTQSTLHFRHPPITLPTPQPISMIAECRSKERIIVLHNNTPYSQVFNDTFQNVALQFNMPCIEHETGIILFPKNFIFPDGRTVAYHAGKNYLLTSGNYIVTISEASNSSNISTHRLCSFIWKCS